MRLRWLEWESLDLSVWNAIAYACNNACPLILNIAPLFLK